MLDKFVHRWLHIPYRLHAEVVRKGHKPVATVVLIHGIGNSSAAWQDVVERLPKNVRVVVIDLLGFGVSPRPSWVTYDARTQARSIMRTYFSLGIVGKVIIVGHSMGALVAIEFAKRYPLRAASLILCSPPLYQPDSVQKKLLPDVDSLLKSLYRTAQKNPQQFVTLSSLAMKYGLVNRAFNVNYDNIESYMAALEAAIINQTSLRDIYSLALPIHIIRGTLDPVVVPGHIKRLAAQRPNVSFSTVVSGHEIKKRFAIKIVATIDRIIGEK